MAKIIIAYGSTTGNTEKMADIITAVLSDGNEVDTKNVNSIKPEEISNYDVVIVGSSTWGDGELQDDMIAFNDALKNVALAGKKSAVFGCGETAYLQFCKAVDILEETIKSAGGNIVTPGVKIDGDIDAAKDAIEEWANKVKGSI
jgi:flavodoxin I